MSAIFPHAAELIRILCAATKIKIDEPRFEDAYVSFNLKESYGIDADFFIRAQSVGITCKGQDIRLFYLLQHQIQNYNLEFLRTYHGQEKRILPTLSGDGKFSMSNPTTFYLATISSGNLRDRCDIPIDRDGLFRERGEYLADFLFTQWIVKIIPIVENYALFKRVGILAEIPAPQ